MKIPNLIANFNGEIIPAFSGFVVLPKGLTSGYKWIIISALKLNFIYQKIVSYNSVGTYLMLKTKYNCISLTYDIVIWEQLSRQTPVKILLLFESPKPVRAWTLTRQF